MTGGSFMERPFLSGDSFLKEIKSPSQNGYFFFVEEDYLKRHALHLAEATLCPDESLRFFNVLKLNALDSTPKQLMEALMPFPVQEEKKLVIVTGLNFNSLKASEIAEWIEALDYLKEYDYNLLILSFASDALNEGFLPQKPSSVFLSLQEALTPVQFNYGSRSRLIAWIGKHFSSYGVSSSPELCGFLLDYCGSDMYNLSSEIEKVSYYILAHNQSAVTEEAIVAAALPITAHETFAFANAILERKQDKALDVLSHMIFQREDPIHILSEISTIFQDLLHVRLLLDDGLSPVDISSVLKFHEYKAKLYIRYASPLTRAALSKVLSLCTEADLSLKNNPKSYEPIEKLVCAL